MSLHQLLPLGAFVLNVILVTLALIVRLGPCLQDR